MNDVHVEAVASGKGWTQQWRHPLQNMQDIDSFNYIVEALESSSNKEILRPRGLVARMKDSTHRGTDGRGGDEGSIVATAKHYINALPFPDSPPLLQQVNSSVLEVF